MRKKVTYKQKRNKQLFVKEGVTSMLAYQPSINNISPNNSINKIYCGDCLDIMKTFPDDFVDLIITSPPYFKQREYGSIGIGNEKTVDEYINNLITVFRQCVRVIKKTGSIVFNVGDKYINGNLLLVPYRFALEALRDRNVKLINEITWLKVNPVPKQDPKKLVSSKEPFFLFVKSNEYYFNKETYYDFKDKYLNRKKKYSGNDIGKKYFGLIDKSNLTENEKLLAKKELTNVILEVKQGKLDSFRMKIRGFHALPYGGQAGGRKCQIDNKGFTIIKIYGNSIKKDVIESTVETIKGNIHPAVYPEFVIQELLKLLTKENDIVLDPFIGSGTTAVVAKRMNRDYIGIEIYPEYVKYAEGRLSAIKPTQNYELELFI